MASRLEGLTKSYKVPLLFTSSLFNMFKTRRVKELCRQIDRIYVEGTKDSWDLYTVDVFPDELNGINEV